ncbi:MAG: hypothetical protein A9Z00_12060 [Thermobacillus sp. ZCTH02-B1]|mgnify:CR=1 FL=1|uniref:flagellar filament capping protein FliD n=1 Tax=Thermobacillus sp. ZCTH02-B1 TaxID=1858795 RepID=UPI000B56BEB0|nr:flagellar filament capping protein FliD [Thermobacillus sp. ZCTH02-B1]OUM94976.1 MAG: hypothetical protein A9Z00_12060 [Thermobacillus sp. ZCTH02-B1]
MSFSLSGIASGLDTNTIISQLMQIERIPYNKLESKKKTYDAQLSVFRTINTKLAALRTAAEDLRLQANFSLRSASISDETVLKSAASDAVQEGVYVVQVEKLATYSTFVTDGVDASGNSLAGLTEITIGLNGNETTINIDEDLSGKTNDEILALIAKKINKKINENKDLGVRATVIQNEPGKKALMLTAKEAGGIEITLDADVSLGGKNKLGQNAVFYINGIEFQSSSNEVRDVINGLSLTLLKEGTSTITVSRDADKVAEKVEAFVKAYNDVIQTIRENTAQGKLLQGDSTLRTLQNTLFSEFNAKVAGAEAFEFLSQIGLSIDEGKTSAETMTGQIVFNKEKFKEALLNDPEGVFRLFSNHDSQNPGIADRFTETLRYWTRSGNGILAARIQGYNAEISFINKQMEDMEIRLAMKEEQLKKQFTAMETMLIQLQNEQAWLNSQLAAFLVR